MRQPFSLFTHCGILTTSFAGRAFYVETLDPSHVAVLGDPLGNPFAPGWMTLVSPHVAEFTDLAGHRIRFVDYLPGEVDQPYPLTVLVISGGNQLGDVQSPAAGGARLTRCLGSVDRRTATGGMPTPRFMER